MIEKASKKKIAGEKNKSAPDVFERYLTVNYMIFAQDVIIGADQHLSIIKLIHNVTARKLPIRLFKFVVIVEFERNTSVPLDEFTMAAVNTELRISDTKGNEQSIQNFAPEPFNMRDPWTVYRFICDLSTALEMENEGICELRVYGSIKDQKPHLIASKGLTVKLSK